MLPQVKSLCNAGGLYSIRSSFISPLVDQCYFACGFEKWRFTPPAKAYSAPSRDAQTADYAPIKEIRLYRTPSGSEIADYFFVGAIPVLGQEGLNFAFNDNIAASGLNEALASTSYYPPNPLLVGLLSLQNGILMAWKGNEVHFSDAYKSWSWPPEYVLTFGDASINGVRLD